MSRLSRRFTSTVLLVVSLALAASAVQARELSPAGWFDAMAHQLAQWTARWWTLPAYAAAGPERLLAAKAMRPPVAVDCGVLIDPNGQCLAAAPPHPKRRPPVAVDCGGLIDPNGRCLSAAPPRR